MNQLAPFRFGAFPDYFKSELMETSSIAGSTLGEKELSRLLQIGINGNKLVWAGKKNHLKSFPDYFKSELMETHQALTMSVAVVEHFPDYFKSELMETP